MTSRLHWSDYAALALVLSWLVVLSLGIVLLAIGSPWFAACFGYCVTSSWGIGRLALHFSRHGLDNHLCHRSCCRFDR